MPNILLIKGDGVGPEIIDAAQKLLTALPLSINFDEAEAGYGAYQKHGTPLPILL